MAWSLQQLISSNVATIGTTAVQVSGPTTNLNNALPGVATGFVPSRLRSLLRITNNSTSATLYLGSTASVTSSNGWFKRLAPGEFFDHIVNGTVPVFLIASAASTPVNLDEYGGSF
jgi:hypothetical protein